MKQLLFKIILLATLFSCEEKEQPIKHEKTTPFTCDDIYFVKLGYTQFASIPEVNEEDIIISNDYKSFYSLDENGVKRFNIDNIQKTWEKNLSLGVITNHFIRPDKKIWLISIFNYGNGQRDRKVFLIDTIGNIFMEKKVSPFANNISGVGNDGFILAYTGIDSIEWFDHSNLVNLGNYNIESYNLSGNLLWKKDYILVHGEVSSLCYLSSDEILVGGYVDSLGRDYGHKKAFLTKLSNSGDIIWTKSYPPIPTYDYQLFKVESIMEDTQLSYNLIINGITPSLKDIFYLVNIDSSGFVNWSTEINGFYKRNNILAFNNNNIIMYNAKGDIKVSFIDKLGQIKWTHQYGGTGFEDGASIHILNSSDLFIVGSTENYDEKGETSLYDYFIRADKDGNICY